MSSNSFRALKEITFWTGTFGTFKIETSRRYISKKKYFQNRCPECQLDETIFVQNIKFMDLLAQVPPFY